MLFTEVEVPSLNVKPDHTVRMRLWSNFIRFCKYHFLCRGLGDITCVSAEQRQRKSYKLQALLIETAFPDTYAALSEPVLFAQVKYNLSFARFCKKISSTPMWVVQELRRLLLYGQNRLIYRNEIYTTTISYL